MPPTPTPQESQFFQYIFGCNFFGHDTQHKKKLEKKTTRIPQVLCGGVWSWCLGVKDPMTSLFPEKKILIFLHRGWGAKGGRSRFAVAGKTFAAAGNTSHFFESLGLTPSKTFKISGVPQNPNS